MRVLLTNDDGITATGLNVMRRTLLETPDVELEVIAPDSNRSATGRAVTLHDPIWVEEVAFGDGTNGFATDGTPVDCVRFAALGLIEEPPELIVSGINHGANLGDDITYSGTVAAALEGIMLGLPAVAVSLTGRSREFEPLARFVARLVEELDVVPMPPGTLLNVNETPMYPDPRNPGALYATSDSKGAARYVLEMNLGWFKRKGLVDGAGRITPGTKAEIPAAATRGTYD